MVTSQRGRLLVAATEIAAEKGYAATSVADILKRAKVSRLTFYEMFDNKEACFIAAYDHVATEVSRGVGDEFSAAGEPMELVGRAIKSYLHALARDPELSRFFLIESHAVGPVLTARRFATNRAIAELIASNFGASTERQRAVCEGFVGAIVALVSSRLMTDGPSAILALYDPIMDLAGPILTVLPELAG